MKRVFGRAGWALFAAGALGLTTPAEAQWTPYATYSNQVIVPPTTAPTTPAPVSAVPPLPMMRVAHVQQVEAATPAPAGPVRLEALKVELAWLSDVSTFGYNLAAIPGEGDLELRGYVPSEQVHEIALSLAREATPLPVQDYLKVQGNLSTRTAGVPVAEMEREAHRVIGDYLKDRANKVEFSIRSSGQVTLKGQIPSYEEKLTVSRKLRQVRGVTSVVNHLVVPASLRNGQLVAPLSADGKDVVSANSMVEPATPTLPPHPTLSVTPSHPVEHAPRPRVVPPTMSVQPMRTSSTGAVPQMTPRPTATMPTVTTPPTVAMPPFHATPAPMVTPSREIKALTPPLLEAPALPSAPTPPSLPKTGSLPQAEPLTPRTTSVKRPSYFATSSTTTTTAKTAATGNTDPKPYTVPMTHWRPSATGQPTVKTTTTTASTTKPVAPTTVSTTKATPSTTVSTTPVTASSPYSLSSLSSSLHLKSAPPPAQTSSASPYASASHAPTSVASAPSGVPQPTSKNKAFAQDKVVSTSAKPTPPAHPTTVAAVWTPSKTATTEVVKTSASQPKPVPPPAPLPEPGVDPKVPAKPYETTGVVFFTGEDPAPALFTGEPIVPEKLRLSIVRLCGKDVSAVHVVTHPDHTVHVQVHVVSKQVEDRVANEVLQLPEMGAPNVKLEITHAR